MLQQREKGSTYLVKEIKPRLVNCLIVSIWPEDNHISLRELRVMEIVKFTFMTANA